LISSHDKRGHLHGVNPEAVVTAIRDRAKRGNDRADGRKLGLVIEGGSIRAVCSAGGAAVLAQMGFSETFDHVYATSAGVMNAAYFISNQPLTGISVYFDHCTTRRFVNPLRFWKIIDVDYIFDEVAVREKPLNLHRVLSSRSRFHVAVIDRNDGQGHLIDTQRASTPLLHSLKAAAAIPVLYNRSILVDGRRCIDGGLRIPFPLKQAIEDGCTDILVLLTRPTDYVNPSPNLFQRTIFNILCARGNAGLNEAFAARPEASRVYRDLAFGRIRTDQPVNIATLATDRPEEIQTMAVSRKILHKAAVDYGRNVLRVFVCPNDAWTIPSPNGHDS
jgi:predicted patatin/cPLA2 family phospholipase